MTLADWHKALFALTIWRESRGEILAGKIGVAWVIRNRVLTDKIGPNRWSAIISERLQFSSMTSPNDPNLIEWPQDSDASWIVCMSVAEGIYNGTTPDNTMGANLYANLSVCNPKWAHTATETVKLGATTFFKGVGVV
jgi:hypothetical protein